MVIDTIETETDSRFQVEGVVDNQLTTDEMVMGYPILGGDDHAGRFFQLGHKNAFLAIGGVRSSGLRQKLFDDYKKIGYEFPVIISNRAIVSKRSELGEGTFVGKGAIISNHVDIGENCIINTAAIVEHHCVLGNHVHIAPRATLCGSVKIGDSTHIGAGSTILQGVTIGNGVTIGIGSVVTKNVPDNVVAYGNPCRVKGT